MNVELGRNLLDDLLVPHADNIDPGHSVRDKWWDFVGSDVFEVLRGLVIKLQDINDRIWRRLIDNDGSRTRTGANLPLSMTFSFSRCHRGQTT